jgi:hypothetical protein
MSALIIHPVDLGAIKCRDPRRPLSPSSLTTLSPPTEELGMRDPRRLANFLLRAFAEPISRRGSRSKINGAGRPAEGPAPHRTAVLECFRSTPVGQIKKITPQTHRPTGFLQTDSRPVTTRTAPPPPVQPPSVYPTSQSHPRSPDGPKASLRQPGGCR